MAERKWLVRIAVEVIGYTPEGEVVEVRELDSAVRERIMGATAAFAATQVVFGQGNRLIVHGVATAESHLDALVAARTAVVVALGPQLAVVDTVGAEANLVEDALR